MGPFDGGTLTENIGGGFCGLVRVILFNKVKIPKLTANPARMKKISSRAFFGESLIMTSTSEIVRSVILVQNF